METALWKHTVELAINAHCFFFPFVLQMIIHVNEIYFKPAISPGSKFHFTGLYIQWKPLNIVMQSIDSIFHSYIFIGLAFLCVISLLWDAIYSNKVETLDCIIVVSKNIETTKTQLKYMNKKSGLLIAYFYVDLAHAITFKP